MEARTVDFVFDEQKTAQAAARLLRRHGAPMEYIKLIKLLYLADRRSLIETGYPITGDKLFSLPKGPVLSQTLNLIRRVRHMPQANWPRYITAPVQYRVSSTSCLEDAELSEYECELLDEILDEYGQVQSWDLVRITHDLPEWSDPGGSSMQIDPAEILRHEGFSEEDIDAVKRQARAVATSGRAFGK